MSSPGLWKRAFGAGLQWRLLGLWLVALALPAFIALGPVGAWLGSQLSSSPRGADAIARLDSATWVDLMRSASDPLTRDLGAGVPGATALALLLATVVAAATVASARAGERLDYRALLRGTGDFFGRSLRLLVVAALPLGLAFALAGGATRIAERYGEQATLESAASRARLLALLAGGAFLFLAHLTVDAARGVLATEPHRRSAFFAWGAGLRLLGRRPLAMLGMGAVTTLLGLGLAAAFTLLRSRVPQGGGGGQALALILSQVALLAIGWARIARVHGFAEICAADAAARVRTPRFSMEPPGSSPEALVAAPAPVAAIPPDREGAA